MKFYIVGNNCYETEAKIRMKKATLNSYDLDEALNIFESVIEEVRFKDCYLICDFENFNRPVFRYESINDDFENMPFFIIGEWHVGEDKKNIIRADHTELVFTGYKQEFENNLTAIRSFINYISEYSNVVFNIVYQKQDMMGDIKVTRKFIRKIADGYSVSKAIYNPKPLKNIRISSPNWEFVPLIPKKFFSYNINKKETSVTVIPRIPKYEVINS